MSGQLLHSGSMFAGTAKAIRAPVTLLEVIYHVKTHLYHRYHDKLRDALQRIQGERDMSAIPA